MKKLFALIGAILLTCNLFAVNVWYGSSQPWANGSGTTDDPYLIETAANLAYLAEKVNEGYEAQGMAVFAGTCFLLTDDLDPSMETSEIKVYPNPVTEVVHIQGIDAAEVQVFNTLGQLLKTVRGTNEVGVGELSRGQYLLRVTDENNTVVFKLLEVVR